MKANLQPGGILWQARQHMASAADVRPLSRSSEEFNIHTSGTTDTMQPIGLVIRTEQYLYTSKKLTLSLSLLNESNAVTPEHQPIANPVAVTLGRIGILLHNDTQHFHKKSDAFRYESRLSGGLDIQSDGEVHVCRLSLDICSSCKRIDLKEESEILDTLGLEELYMNRLNFVTNGDTRSSTIADCKLTNHQVRGLQDFMLDNLPIGQGS